MKIALYTIFRCTNYGAVLQACALARTLRRMLGEDSVDVINHLMDPRDNHLLGKIANPNTPWFQRWRNRRKFAAKYIRPDLFEVRRQNTIRLIETQIRPMERLYRCPQEFRGLPSYGTVVVGSDQVWNPILNHDFGHNQYLADCLPDGQDRVAYAASFGVSELPMSCRDEYRTALSRFRKITVREESGADICQTLLGTRPEVVLDPTLILSASEWEALAGDGQFADGSIVAYWVRTVTQGDVDALAQVARRGGSSVRLMSAGPLPKLAFPKEVVPFVDADPFDFVRAIAASSAVITDSFHGLQFATLFRRPFLALGELSDPRSNASRLVDFGARYGLSGGIHDIEQFRSGAPCPVASFASFDASAFEADRDRSIRAMEGLLR